MFVYNLLFNIIKAKEKKLYSNKSSSLHILYTQELERGMDCLYHILVVFGVLLYQTEHISSINTAVQYIYYCYNSTIYSSASIERVILLGKLIKGSAPTEIEISLLQQNAYLESYNNSIITILLLLLLYTIEKLLCSATVKYTYIH